MQEVIIAAASRTPMGGFQSAFDGVAASRLGGTVDHEEDDWWSVRVGDDEPVCVQLAPDHQPPQWPDGLPQ